MSVRSSLLQVDHVLSIVQPSTHETTSIFHFKFPPKLQVNSANVCTGMNVHFWFPPDVDESGLTLVHCEVFQCELDLKECLSLSPLSPTLCMDNGMFIRRHCEWCDTQNRQDLWRCLLTDMSGSSQAILSNPSEATASCFCLLSWEFSV